MRPARIIGQPRTLLLPTQSSRRRLYAAARLAICACFIGAGLLLAATAGAPGAARLAVDFSCLEDVVKPVGAVASDGADTVAIMALRAWAVEAWKGIRPLSMDSREHERRYLLLEEEAGLLREFAEAYPESPWTPPILAKLGNHFRRIGRYSVALQLWDEAWRLTRTATDPATRELADDTLAELVTLLAQLGHAEKLEVILAEGAGRHLRLQPHGERVRNAAATLTAMNAAPEWCYRCGGLAVGLVGNALTGTRDYTRAVAKLHAPPTGFSLYQLQELARGLSLDMVAAHWSGEPEIVVPSVVHWQDQHYAAIVEGHGNWYVVKDPTMREPIRLHRSAILAEASGFFLVPRALVPNAWVRLSAQDASTVLGRGYDDSLADDQDEPGCPYGTAPASYGGGGGGAEPGGGGCGGGGCWSKAQPEVMEWYVSEPFINLWLRDTPLRYQPPAANGSFPSTCSIGSEAARSSPDGTVSSSRNWETASCCLGRGRSSSETSMSRGIRT